MTTRVTRNGDVCLTEQVFRGTTVDSIYEDFFPGNSTTSVARLQLTTDAEHGTVTCSSIGSPSVSFDLTLPACAAQLTLLQQQCTTGACN